MEGLSMDPQERARILIINGGGIEEQNDEKWLFFFLETKEY